MLAAILVVHPVAEIPNGDEFSYIRSAQILAQTGHITYVGFSEPILGWQLYLGAMFIKLFGFSYTVVRCSISVLGILAVFVCYSTCVRAGLRPWNASVGTLTLVLSPLFIEQSTTFQTDLAGFFAILLCLYACLRASQARGSNAAIAWIGFAVLSNAVLGTARQVAWLGLLIMVPSALWLLRRNRRVVLAGATFYVIGVLLIGACLAWFQRQPYTQHESLLPGPLSGWVFHRIAIYVLRIALEIVFLTVPVMIVFLPALWKWRQRWQTYLLGLFFAVGAIVLWQRHELASWFSPFVAPSYFWFPPYMLNAVLTTIIFLTVLALVSAALVRKQSFAETTVDSSFRSQGHSVGVLVLPFAFAYSGLLLLRSGFEPLWDRYMLPLLLISIILAVRFYQGQADRKLPKFALLLAIVLGGYGAAIVRDNFVYLRASLAALKEILAKGVPATEITGGWAFDALTELQIGGHVYGPHILLPKGTVAPVSTHYGIDNCVQFYCDMFPHVVPKYALAGSPDPEVTEFAPVPYRTWVTPSGSLFVVRFR